MKMCMCVKKKFLRESVFCEFFLFVYRKFTEITDKNVFLFVCLFM